MAIDLFEQINNAVLDIQAADYPSVLRPMKQLARLLEHDELKAINEPLTDGLDADTFIVESQRAGSGKIGGGTLDWPDDHRQDLGLRLLLIRKLGEDGDLGFQFSHQFYSNGGNKVSAGFHGMARQLIIPFVRDYKAYVLNRGQPDAKVIRKLSNRIFIVHGHDGEARETVARHLSGIGLDPVILHEQANRGRTVIEKVEANSDVSFAVVLLTPDDLGRAKGDTDLEPRARQNVLLELGYFIAKLGRDKVCALRRGDVVIPSDFAGVVWTDIDAAGAWKTALARELQAAGHQIDWNKVMR